MTKSLKFSICVPTYNRKHTLMRLIDSIEKQTYRNFELIIIDDGSTDGTEAYIRKEIEVREFIIKYAWQPNGGRHRALNRMHELTEGELIIVFDSDDILLPNALARMAYHWGSIEAEEKHRFAGVEGLCVDEKSNRVIGTCYPKEVFDSDHVTNYYILGLTGDRTRAIRSRILEEIRFPEVPGEKYIPPAYVWNRIALRYKYRYFNEKLAIKGYQPGGVTDKSATFRVRNPIGARMVYLDFITTISSEFKVKKRFYYRNYINYIRFSIHCKTKISNQLEDAPSIIVFFFSFPFAVLLSLRDKLLLKREK